MQITRQTLRNYFLILPCGHRKGGRSHRSFLTVLSLEERAAFLGKMSPSRAEDELSAPETGRAIRRGQGGRQGEGRKSKSISQSFSVGHAAKFSGNEHVGPSEGRRDLPPARGSSHMTSPYLYPAQRVSEEFKKYYMSPRLQDQDL